MPITATNKAGFNDAGGISGPVTINALADGVELIYTILNKQNNAAILRLDYTKGTETNIQINYARIVSPDTDYYYEIYDSGSGTLALYTQTITDGAISSNPIIIPIPKGKDDDTLKIIIKGDNGAAADGTVEFFITEDNFAF